MLGILETHKIRRKLEAMGGKSAVEKRALADNEMPYGWLEKIKQEQDRQAPLVRLAELLQKDPALQTDHKGGRGPENRDLLNNPHVVKVMREVSGLIFWKYTKVIGEWIYSGIPEEIPGDGEPQDPRYYEKAFFQENKGKSRMGMFTDQKGNSFFILQKAPGEKIADDEQWPMVYTVSGKRPRGKYQEVYITTLGKDKKISDLEEAFIYLFSESYTQGEGFIEILRERIPLLKERAFLEKKKKRLEERTQSRFAKILYSKERSNRTDSKIQLYEDQIKRLDQHLNVLLTKSNDFWAQHLAGEREKLLPVLEKFDAYFQECFQPE